MLSEALLSPVFYLADPPDQIGNVFDFCRGYDPYVMTHEEQHNLPSILSVGTAVVSTVEIKNRDGKPACPRGSVGVITRAPGDPEHRYRVRFPGGEEASLRRLDLAILKHFQREGLERDLNPMVEHDLYRHVIFQCVIGSRAYGLDHEDSDTDRRGIYLP